MINRFYELVYGNQVSEYSEDPNSENAGIEGQKNYRNRVFMFYFTLVTSLTVIIMIIISIVKKIQSF